MMMRHTWLVACRQIQRQQAALRPLSRCMSSRIADKDALDPLLQLPPSSDALKQRVYAYLDVDGAKLDTMPAALRRRTVRTTSFVERLQRLIRWSFHQQASPQHSTAVLASVANWTNMVQDTTWEQFYMRQFFLTGAPIAAFVDVFELHKRCNTSGKATGSLPSSLLVKELCRRGRFEEALQALKDLAIRQDAIEEVVRLLQEYEQYQVVVQLYREHEPRRGKRSALPPLPLLTALKNLDRIDELQQEYRQLSRRQQAQKDIQQLMESV